MFCSSCGKKLPDGAAFCDKCGKPTGPAEEKRGALWDGPQNENAAPAPKSADPERSPAVIAEPEDGVFEAPEASGESPLGFMTGILSEASDELIPGPAGAIGGGIKTLFSNIGAAFKDPKRLIPAFILCVVWIVLNILKASGKEPVPVKILELLTFANGGTGGGVMRIIGGLLGKSLFAGALVSLLSGNKAGGERLSLKDSFGFTPDVLFPYLMGAGAALLIFLFISGGAPRMAFMGGIAASYLAARAAVKEGFLKKLTGSFASKGKPEAGPGAAGFIKGLASGFALSALIGLVNVKQIILIAGLVLATGGAILTILRAAGVIKLGKGAKAQ